MKKFNCPSCGAEVIFQSNSSIYAVCTYCNSMIVRHDLNVETIGTMAALPEDMSPLMLGTEGHINQLRFRLIGRMKVGWQDGQWNEWYLLFDNGTYGWLAEAQGFFAVCNELEDGLPHNAKKAIDQRLHQAHSVKQQTSQPEPQLSALRNALLGLTLHLNQLNYQVVDVKNALCVGSEGELPFAAPQGRKTLSLDLVGHHGEFANIEISQDKTRSYIGRYMEWADLHLQHLRPLEGW